MESPKQIICGLRRLFPFHISARCIEAVTQPMFAKSMDEWNVIFTWFLLFKDFYSTVTFDIHQEMLY